MFGGHAHQRRQPSVSCTLPWSGYVRRENGLDRSDKPHPSGLLM